MKKIISALLILILVLSLCSCIHFVKVKEKPSDLEIISKGIGIDVTNGKLVSKKNTHDGFLGDGTTSAKIDFFDNEAEKQIQQNAAWKPFPTDETIKELLTFDSEFEFAPFVEKIENGYYILIDRQKDQSEDILSRGSYNFTAAFYDADQKVMYFWKFDT